MIFVMILKYVVHIIKNIKCHLVNYGFIFLKDVKIKEIKVIHIINHLLGHKYKVCPYNSLHIIILPKWESHV